MLEEREDSVSNSLSGGSTGSEAVTLLDTRRSDEATAPLDGSSHDETSSNFCPHILHEPHQPVPIALVNRLPSGSEPSSSYSI